MTLRGAVFRYTLALEAAGFLLIIVIIWLDEILDLPRLLFGTTATPLRPGEGLLESALALAVGVVVVTINYRAFRRIEYLESLVVICAWCRRVRAGDEWLAMEQFMERQHHAHTTHGICSTCAAGVLVPPS